MAEPVATPPPAARTDRSPWNWLLVIPIVLPLLVPIYNHVAPRLNGFPLFYWLQLAFIFVGVATTTLVYRMTARPATPVDSAAPAAAPAAEDSDE